MYMSCDCTDSELDFKAAIERSRGEVVGCSVSEEETTKGANYTKRVARAGGRLSYRSVEVGRSCWSLIVESRGRRFGIGRVLCS